MLKIVEKVVSSPVRFPIKPGIKVKAGMVGRLVEYDGHLVVDISDDGSQVFGVIGNKRFIDGKSVSFDREDLVNIWPQRMVFKTDIYDKTAEYENGQALYVNDGLLTAKSVEGGSPLVARLTRTPSADEKSYIEVLWL